MITPFRLTVAAGTSSVPSPLKDDDFNDGLRLLDATDDVEPGRGEHIRAAQGSLRARPSLASPMGSRTPSWPFPLP